MSKNDDKDYLFGFSEKIPAQKADGEPESFETFTTDEKLFIAFYLTDAKFNQTAAAKLAGFNCSSETAFRVAGCRMMKKPKIRAAINSAMGSFIMPKMEVIFRLARFASVSMADLLNDDGEIDLDKARSNGSIDCIESIEIDRRIVEVSSEQIDTPGGAETLEKSISTEKIKVKLYSAKDALALVGKYYSLFVDRTSLENPDGSAIETGAVLFLPPNGRDGENGE